MARGFGSSFAIARQPSEYLLSSMAFMGEPCPTNMTGILSVILNSSFRRAKRLPDLKQLLRKLDPARVMSGQAIRAAILGIAESMGAKVVRKSSRRSRLWLR